MDQIFNDKFKEMLFAVYMPPLNFIALKNDTSKD
jgi:hypothetical protein